MKLYEIIPRDFDEKMAAVLTVAEVKAIYNALAVDAQTGGGTSPGVDLQAAMEKMVSILDGVEVHRKYNIEL